MNKGELVAMRVYKESNGATLRYESGHEEDVSRQYACEQIGDKTFLKAVALDGEWLEL